MKTLIMTVGLPYSGKSTWARDQEHPIVCPDEIRRALHGRRFEKLAEPFVWAIAKVMVRALFLAGHDTVILDATNVSHNRRLEWRSKEWVVGFKVIRETREECIRRAKAAGDSDIIPIIDRMAEEYQEPGMPAGGIL